MEKNKTIIFVIDVNEKQLTLHLCRKCYFCLFQKYKVRMIMRIDQTQLQTEYSWMGVLPILGGAPLDLIECFNFYKLKNNEEFFTTSMREGNIALSRTYEKRVGTIPSIEDQKIIKDYLSKRGLSIKVHPYQP